MSIWIDLAAIVLAFAVVTVSPGPANLAVATIAMARGRRRALSFGYGLSIGLAAWGLVAATGLGAILQQSADALFILKIGGGIYLLWLAWQSARSAATPLPPQDQHSSETGGFWQGLLLNLSNPKAVVAWMAALSLGLGADEGLAMIALATIACMFVGLLNYSGHALLFSLPGIMAWYRGVRRWIDTLVAGLFTLAGLGLVRSALARSSA